MPKLYFRFGTMNSSKTANLLMVAHNYKSQNKKVLLIKPKCDDRFGTEMIVSRAGPSAKADILMTPEMKTLSIDTDTLCILVDEVQFLSEENINLLREISLKIPVICYGLRTDYQSKLFPGSKRLMEIADSIEEIKTTCVLCLNKAIINAKFYYDEELAIKKILKEGSSDIDLGAENKYQAMCWKCWSENA